MILRRFSFTFFFIAPRFFGASSWAKVAISSIASHGSTESGYNLLLGHRLPKVFLYARSDTEFYMKEAPLKFEFVKDVNKSFKIVTYNNRGKDAEWTKTC